MWQRTLLHQRARSYVHACPLHAILIGSRDGPEGSSMMGGGVGG